MNNVIAVIASTNHDDFLDITIPANKDLYKRYIVITSPEDIKTQEVCQKYKTECYTSTGFTHNNSKFNRGRVYNEVIDLLWADQSDYWVNFLDSDIIVPAEAKKFFDISDLLDKSLFFGARRYDCTTKELFDLYKNDWTNLPLLRGFGYGFFQMFNIKSEIIVKHPYPEYASSSEGDWVFRNFWGEIVYEPNFDLRGHAEPNVKDFGTGLLRETPFSVLHLGITGINGAERLTPRFA